MSCEPRACAPAQCPFPVRGDCCPTCDGEGQGSIGVGGMERLGPKYYSKKISLDFLLPVMLFGCVILDKLHNSLGPIFSQCLKTHFIRV